MLFINLLDKRFGDSVSFILQNTVKLSKILVELIHKFRIDLFHFFARLIKCPAFINNFLENLLAGLFLVIILYLSASKVQGIDHLFIEVSFVLFIFTVAWVRNMFIKVIMIIN